MRAKGRRRRAVVVRSGRRYIVCGLRAPSQRPFSPGPRAPRCSSCCWSPPTRSSGRRNIRPFASPRSRCRISWRPRGAERESVLVGSVRFTAPLRRRVERVQRSTTGCFEGRSRREECCLSDRRVLEAQRRYSASAAKLAAIRPARFQTGWTARGLVRRCRRRTSRRAEYTLEAQDRTRQLHPGRRQTSEHRRRLALSGLHLRRSRR